MDFAMQRTSATVPSAHATMLRTKQRFVVSVVAYDSLPGHQALFLSDCIISAFGRNSHTFEKPGHHSRLLLLSLDDIYWQGNADSRRWASDFRL
jgi:hypothetical protein